MNKLLYTFLIFTVLFGGCKSFSRLQKAQIVSVYHLIEAKRFNEARGLVEEMANDENTANWSRVWYSRGNLAHTAWREGVRTNEARLQELYPNQLYVAFESFEKALKLEPGGRMERKLTPRYIQLANDFYTFGERHFRRGNFAEALRAFEHAQMLIEGSILPPKTDTLLIYNAGMAAFESRNWDRAIKQFSRLHGYGHSAGVTRLLFELYLAAGDTLAAENTILEGIDNFSNNEQLILALTEWHLDRKNPVAAMEILEEAIAANPLNPVFHNLKGFVFLETGNNSGAIASFREVVRLTPDDLHAYIHIATGYYNIGVGIDENARMLTQINQVRLERERSAQAYAQAIAWLDKVYERNDLNRDVLQRLYQLYRLLRVSERADSVQQRLGSHL